MKNESIDYRIERGNQCIQNHSKMSVKASFIPLVSIPIVHGICLDMFRELDQIFGTCVPRSEEGYSNVAIGAIATPFMAIPVWGAIAAASYIETVGKSYLAALIEQTSQQG